MKNKLTFTLICSLFLLSNCTVPSGEDVTMYFPVDAPYSRLYVSDGMEVTVTDEVDEIVITGDENIMEKITVDISSNKLRIYRRDISLVFLTPTKVMLPYNENLREVELKMDSEFYTPYGIESNEVSITVEGRSKFEGYVNANTLRLKMDDHSKADLTGYAPNLRLDMSNESEIEEHWDGDYFTMECDKCYGSMSQSTAHIHCYDEIDVTMSNRSYLYYTGADVTVYYGNVDDSSDVVYCGGNKKK